MKIKNIAIAYGAAVLVLGVGIDVSARLQNSSPSIPSVNDTDEDSDEAEAAKADVADDEAPAKAAAPAQGADGPRASAKACDQLFERQKEVAVELAMAFHPEKNKAKARKKVQREIGAKMDAERDNFATACSSLSAAEVTCVLAEEDLTKWVECGPGVAKLGQ